MRRIHSPRVKHWFFANFTNPKGGIAAAQTFETIFYLIGSGRWVAVVTSMASCIELFLRAKHDEVDVSSSGLQKQMSQFEAHTDEGKKKRDIDFSGEGIKTFKKSDSS